MFVRDDDVEGDPHKHKMTVGPFDGGRKSGRLGRPDRVASPTPLAFILSGSIPYWTLTTPKTVNSEMSPNASTEPALLEQRREVVGLHLCLLRASSPPGEAT